MTASIRTGALSGPQRKKFEAWLAHHGAEILAPTNPFEILRFRAGPATGVIYNSRGMWSVVDVAVDALECFKGNKPWKAPIPKVKPVSGTRYYHALVKRDGPECFYCGEPVTPEDSSLEHIVPRSLGGPNHMANFALAHRKCNTDAGNLSAVEKVKLREKMRGRVHHNHEEEA